MGLIRPNDLFYCSFTQVRGKLSLFFLYVDLEYDAILLSNLIGPNKAEWPLLSLFTHVRGKLSLFFDYIDLEDDVILSSDLIGPNKAQWPLLSLFHPSMR